MIIAVDDSGDPGFKLGKGSSEYFVIAAIFFDDDLDAEEAALNIKRLRKSLHWNPSHEFKFRKSSAEIKRLFFEVIAPLNFRAAISIVDKRHFADKTLQRETSKFYNTIILRTLLTNGQFSRAHIYIDGEGGNDYRRKVKTFFRQNLPRNAIRGGRDKKLPGSCPLFSARKEKAPRPRPRGFFFLAEGTRFELARR